MRVDVIIPTYNRPELLKQTVESLKNSLFGDLGIYIVIDGNPDLFALVRSWGTAILINMKRRDWIFSMNRALKYARGDAVIYASDDLVFESTCIKRAAARMLLKVPDLDGLVAIKQSVMGCSTAFGMLGRKFIERFPDRQVFCPDYVHYGSDFELGKFARSIGRLFMCDEARVHHNRPHDETHRLAKPAEKKDFSFIERRKAQGLLWGRDFKLLSMEKGK